MAISDFIDSAPSVTGAGLTTYACFAVPSAIPLALMQGAVISDPAEIWRAGAAHTDLAGKANTTKSEITQAVDKRASADNWEGNDKNMFVQANVEPYKSALDQTAQTHDGINDALSTLAKVYMGAGLLSLTIGGILAACASGVIACSWIPGANVAAEGAATAAAETSTGVFRTILSRLALLISKAGKLLSSLKGQGILALAGAVEFWSAKTGLTTTGASPAIWPGVAQPGQPGQAPA
ncbi:hypothetical protein [Actinomadura sp. DC4]|uniref:hypothetical protein n=1 Tax=Actinomadura sp. DC4 TaxID=3055069 RepID=UPI0025B00596|nr:hypothetical protein [Actinomadura sp. DC4]MDN3359711.1 hypothetical protein [Actinomadura sp. DC4]